MYKKILFYDCEIKNLIPDRYGYIDKYTYAKGWDDFEGMGIACVGTYATWKGYGVFLSNQLEEFRQLVDECDILIGFNSISFDDRLLAANGVNIETTYDLLCEVRIASGQPPHYTRGVTRGGYALENLAKTNLGRGKTGTGSLAPQLWQNNQYEQVVQYCLNDVELLKELWERRSHIIDPTNGKILRLQGGSRWQWLKAVAAKWVQAKKEAWRTSDCRVFLWAIARSDISGCSIHIHSPVTWGRYCNQISISFRPPGLMIYIPQKMYNDFAQATGEHLYPF